MSKCEIIKIPEKAACALNRSRCCVMHPDAYFRRCRIVEIKIIHYAYEMLRLSIRGWRGIQNVYSRFSLKLRSFNSVLTFKMIYGNKIMIIYSFCRTANLLDTWSIQSLLFIKATKSFSYKTFNFFISLRYKGFIQSTTDLTVIQFAYLSVVAVCHRFFCCACDFFLETF